MHPYTAKRTETLTPQFAPKHVIPDILAHRGTYAPTILYGRKRIQYATPDMRVREQFYRLVLVRDGVHTLHHASSSQRCGPGSLYLLLPGESIRCTTSPGNKASLIAFTVIAAKLKKAGKDQTKQVLWPASPENQPQPEDIWGLTLPQVLAASLTTNIGPLIQEIVASWWISDHDHFHANLRLSQILEDIYTYYADKAQSKTEIETGGMLQTRIVPLIEKQLAQLQTVEDLADLVQVSPRHLHRHFKEEVGESPAACLRQRKIERAKRLLKTTRKSITQIADDLGFSSPAAFNNTWRQFHDISPKEWNKIIA